MASSHYGLCATFVTTLYYATFIQVYRGFLSVKIFAAGYALTYITTPKLQLVSWTAVGLTSAKFKPTRLIICLSFRYITSAQTAQKTPILNLSLIVTVAVA
jgi:hypothetical protein